MAVKYLDLDTVRQPIGEFRLAGKKYKVWPLKIRQLLNAQASAPTDAGETELSRLLDTLQDTVPDCPREVLESLDLAQLNALTTWVNTQGTEDASKNSNGLPPVVNAPTTVA